MTQRGVCWLISLEAMFQFNISLWNRPDDRATREAWAELNLIWEGSK